MRLVTELKNVPRYAAQGGGLKFIKNWKKIVFYLEYKWKVYIKKLYMPKSEQACNYYAVTK